VLVAVCTGVVPAAAAAQSSPIDRIEAIERQIKNLTGELQHLKNELGEAKRQLKQSRDEAQRSKEEARQAREAADQARQDAVRAPTAESQAAQAAAQAQAAAATPPAAVAASEGVTVSMPRGRPTIATADGRRSLALGGLMQFDMGGYFQNVNPNTEFPHLNNGVNLRRGRLYFLGTFDDFTANITPDFGDRPDGVVSLFEANVNYIGIKPLTFTVGYYHPWVSLDDATNPANELFLERPGIVNVYRRLAAGIARASLGANAATEDYFASAYLTGPRFGAQQPTLLNGEQLGFVGRLAVRPYHDDDWNLHAGVSGQMVFRPNVTANGIPGVSRTTLDFGVDAELEIDFNELVNTGSLSASGANAYGGALGASWRNFLVMSEYYQINVNQSKLPGLPSPTLGFNGVYVDLAWVLTGEPILRHHEGCLEQAQAPSPVQPRRRRHRRVGNRGPLQRSQSRQQRYSWRAAKRHRRCLWRTAAGRQSRAQLVPERLAALHSAIPTYQCKQAELRRHSPNWPALRDARSPGAGRLVIANSRNEFDAAIQTLTGDCETPWQRRRSLPTGRGSLAAWRGAAR
jgi:phosphate-selective porin OprO/OprP